MNEIINKIKSYDKYYWFIPKKTRLALISKGKTKSEAKQNFKNKLINLEKYLNLDIIVAKIKVLKEVNMFAGGPVGIHFNFKQINDEGKIVNKLDPRVNTIWFSEKYLLNNGFKSEFIIKILTAIYYNKVEIPIIGVLTYDYYSKII